MRMNLLAAAALLLLVACEPSIMWFYSDGSETGARGSGTSGAGGAAGASAGEGGSGGALVCLPGSFTSCYSGPPGTVGVGICKAGTKSCEPDGKGYGACVGEVTPKPEDCSTPADEDCDGMTPPCGAASRWPERFGDAGDQAAYGIAVDSTGNVFVTGWFAGAVDFGGGALESASSSDIFLVKLDPNGNHLWSRRFGQGSAFQETSGVAVDTAGNVVITGGFLGTVDFGGGPLVSAGGLDVFVAKLDGNGNHLWSRRFGDITTQQAMSVAVDPAGNVLVTGHFDGTVDFGGGPVSDVGGGSNAFLIKLSPTGAHLWSRSFGDDGCDQAGTGVAADGAGNVLVTGRFGCTIDFGGGPLQSAGAYDVFLAKLDASGAHLWSRRFGDAAWQDVWGLAVDATGAAVITGGFNGTIDFGGGPLLNGGDVDMFVAKLDASGHHAWSKRYGGLQNQVGAAVAVDGAGGVVLTGYLNGVADFGGGALQSAGSSDLFVVKLDAAGHHVWSKRFGDDALQVGTAIAATSGGEVLVAGEFAGTIAFGASSGASLQSAGGTDIFVAKLPP